MLNYRQLIKEGTRYVVAKRRKQWIRCCQRAKEDDRLLDIYNHVLVIMKLLAEGNMSYNEIMEKVGENDNSIVIENYIVAFSPFGFDFAKESPNFSKSKQRIETLTKLHEENVGLVRKKTIKKQSRA